MYDSQELPNGHTGNNLMIFMLGAAVGATVALLCAPASGREIRSQISDKAKDLKDSAVELKERAVVKMDEWKDKAASTAAEALDRAAETVKKTSDSHQFSSTMQEVGT